MNFENLLKSFSNLDFEHIIRRESREYLTSGYENIPYADRNDDKKIINHGLKRFVNKNDKVIFLLEAVNYLNEELSEVNEYFDDAIITSYNSKKSTMTDYHEFNFQQNLQGRKKKCESQLFYAVRELERLGLTSLDKNAFSTSQVSDLTRKLNAILIKIDELAVGQEIIFNFIDEFKSDLIELKSDFPLGKKRWYQRFAGVVSSYLGNKSADELYELLKPEIVKIIHDSTITALLK